MILRFPVKFFALVLVLLSHPVVICAASNISNAFDTPRPISQKALQLKIKDAEADTEIDEASKSRLLDYYRKTNRYLEEIHANEAAVQRFMDSRESGPKQAVKILQQLEKRKISIAKRKQKKINDQRPLKTLEQVLLTEKANLAAVRAKLSDIEQQLILAAARPNFVRQHLIAAKQNQEDITASLLQPNSSEELPDLRQALQWLLETRQIAVRTEIRKLDQELLSLPMRKEFLEAGRAWNAFNVAVLSQRMQDIQDVVNQKRQVEAEKARAAAQQAKQKLADKHILVRQLAAQNSQLTEELSQLSKELEFVTRQSEKTRNDKERIVKQFQRIRKKLDVGGYIRAEGQVLIELKRQLPKLSVFNKRKGSREQRIADLGIQQMHVNEEYRELSSISRYIDKLTQDFDAAEKKQIQGDLKKLAQSRRNQLEQFSQVSNAYLRALSEYDFNDNQLRDTILQYEDFLAQNLLWLRSGPMPTLASLARVPTQVADMFAVAKLRTIVAAFLEQPLNSPVLIFGLVFCGFLFARQRWLSAKLRATGQYVGIVSRDTIASTFKGLGITILLAARWPLLLSVLAWQLKISSYPSPYTQVFSHALFWLSAATFGFQFFRILFIDDGLAMAHFRIHSPSVRQLHRELGVLMFIFLPCAFLFVVMYSLDLGLATGEAGRLLIALVIIGLALFFYHVTSTQHSLMHDALQGQPDNRLLRWLHRLRLPLMAVFGVMIIFVILGYTYSVTLVTSKMIHTLGLILVLGIGNKLLHRWILLSQRKLAWKAALKKRDANRAKRAAEAEGQLLPENETEDLESDDVDLAVLSKESSYLLHVVIVLLGFMGLTMIWAQVLPAFNLLDNVVLWKTISQVSGEQQVLEITLMNIAQAVFTVFVTAMAAKYLPSLLEIIMLQQTPLTAGSRYTVTTITNYIVIAVGMVLFFNILGVDWSRVQWLIAALGVGIGFGLQEIVANFISGIIILFERPIRVGDIVTIGENDGVVVRIRIRATTIRNWDRKELLVPNKEFITGQLINWTLSEQTTRIVVAVGLAYGHDVELAMKLMLEAAKENTTILTEPEPSVVFDAFAENALSLKLRCFVAETEYRIPAVTDLHIAINNKFNQAGLVIAYPQRDVHLDTRSPLQVRIAN